MESKQILENGEYGDQVYESCSQPEGYDLCGVEWPFPRGCLRPLKDTDIYFIICNSSKTSCEAITKIMLQLGVTTAWGIVLKSYSMRVENINALHLEIHNGPISKLRTGRHEETPVYDL